MITIKFKKDGSSQIKKLKTYLNFDQVRTDYLDVLYTWCDDEECSSDPWQMSDKEIMEAIKVLCGSANAGTYFFEIED